MADRVGIMLNHEDRIAQVAETFERSEQAVIVALVQADAWFVKNIKDADQPGADLRREADALGFAAAERAALTIQREIAKADVFQKAEPGTNFFDDFSARFFPETPSISATQKRHLLCPRKGNRRP